MAGTNRAVRALVAATALISSLVLVGPTEVSAQTDPTSPVFINELHYDNDGGDVGEFVEVAGPAGTNLTGWTVVRYNGSNGTAYGTDPLSGTLADESNGYGFALISLPANGLQNGSPDGLALVDAAGDVVEFLSYEGSFAATDGPASGITSTDIGVSEPGTTPIGQSLQRTGTGDTAGDFTWTGPATGSPGDVNTGQTFSGGPTGPTPPVINELGVSDSGGDNEFAEFLGDADTDYSAYTLLEVEGDNAYGLINNIVPLGTTGPDGRFTVDPAPSFQNGSTTFLLVEGFTGANGDDLDTNDDGTFDISPWTAIVDSVSINDGGSGDLHYGTPVLDESFDDARLDNGFSPGGLSRIPDGTDTDTAADWYRNDFSWDGVTNGSPEPGEALNTPGAANEIVPPPAATILINEVDADQVGTDSAEFVELSSGEVGGASLDGLVLVLYNGSDDASYEAYDLDGFTTGADGYFVACGNPATTANCDLDIDGASGTTSNVIQNGADAVALYEGDASDFPNDTPVTADGLLDAIVYDTNDSDDAALLAVLNAVGGQINEGENGNSAEHSNSRCPDSSGVALDTSPYDAVAPTPGAANDCGGTGGPEAKFIHEIQGPGDTSPLDGVPVMISGIVVGDYQEIVTGDPNDEPLEGFFVQEEDADADADPATSEGIFVFYPANAVAVSVGDLVEVTGTVDEFFGLTEIVNVTDVTVVSSGNPAPTPATPILPTSVGDPVVDWEAIEGMSVSFSQPLFVTGMFPLGAFGEVQLSAIGPQDHPNQVHPVGSQAAIDQRQLNQDARVILEDGEDENESFPSGIPTWNPTPTPFLGGPDNTLRSGDEVANLTGVVNYAFNEFEVVPVNVADPTDPDGAVTINRTPRPSAVPDVGGELTVASFNVLNYFTTIDTGGALCGPPGFQQGCRGADTQSEFDIQSAKIADAVADLDADIVGLIELENSGTDAAIADLVAKVNALSPRTYDYVPTGFIGTDAIAVGFIYDTATVGLDGNFAILDSSVSPAFIDTANRPALAQTFVDLATNSGVTIAVNHLKSKGSSCAGIANPGDPAFGVAPYAAGDDIDVGTNGDPDYTGNCNLTRTAAAQVLGGWLDDDPTNTGVENTLVLGDLNAYANETPITALEALGYVDLNESFNGNAWATGGHTYVFDGELGALDYAMSNAALTPFVTGAAAWHINADEPFAIDYQNFNPPGQATLDEWKSSDHDPVIVGLTFDTVPAGSVFTPVESCVVGDSSSFGPLDGLSVTVFQITGTLPLGQGAEAGDCGVPAGASAVLVNITADDPLIAGNFRASAEGVPASGGVVNFAALSPALENSNAVVVPLSASGAMQIEVNCGGPCTSPTSDVRLTVLGFFDEPSGAADELSYVPVTPCAAFDSRTNQGSLGGFAGPYDAGEQRTFQIAGAFSAGQGGGNTDCGVPAGASAVMINLVALNAALSGDAAIGAGGSDPDEPVLSFAPLSPQMNNANAVIVPLNSSGQLVVEVQGASGLVDMAEMRGVVLGYLTDPAAGAEYFPVTPCAAFDSRTNQGATGGFAGAFVDEETRTYTIGGVFAAGQGGGNTTCDVPVGADAVLINLVAINPSLEGNLRVAATGTVATGGVVNFASLSPAMNNSNAIIVPLSASGQLDVTANLGVITGVPGVEVRGVVLGYLD